MNNPFSLNNKTILITGASSGIGRAIAIECAKLGAKLFITGRNKTQLYETLNSLKGKDHHLFVGDLSLENDLKNLIEVLPKLDGCVNNAGISKLLPVQFINRTDLAEILEINTFAPILIVQQIIKKKLMNNGGSIVFTSSVSGIYCSAIASSLYSTSKGAINGFIKGAALDLATRGIRVNSVNPGMIDTGIFSEGLITEDQKEKDVLKYPLRRYGKPEEVAYGIIYLLSDASKWVTGTNLLIDGGYTLL